MTGEELLRDILSRLHHVTRMGDYYRAPCPAHGGQHLNLSLRLAPDGGLIIKCWSQGCSRENILASLGLGGTFTGPTRAGAEGPRGVTVSEEHRREAARHIWNEAIGIEGTLVEKYLRARGLDPAGVHSLRYAGGLKHPSKTWAPAMIASVETEIGLVGIQRTFLKEDGSGKAELEPNKLSLGVCRGGTVRLYEATASVVLAEGIETSIACHMMLKLPVWATLGTSGLLTVELPERIREVMIAADKDPLDPRKPSKLTGEAAAARAADRLRKDGRSVTVLRLGTLAPKRDWNDLLKQRR